MWQRNDVSTLHVTPVVKPNKHIQYIEDYVIATGSHPACGLCDILIIWKISRFDDKAVLQSLLRLIDIAPEYNEKYLASERRLNHRTSVMVEAAMEITELGVSGKQHWRNILSNPIIESVNAGGLIQDKKQVSRDSNLQSSKPYGNKINN
ncbi:hypothetical protein ASPFODRAFT_49921 [Aspergillus luchuensis CBS 106.47]|uniref:Uncharacterized protein n=1 Tax=Aspergillus luchuensis (strain CBS 106.47) TaxID=1137211 RepID=A0A1M3T936_ASPLC|nr:hypothetical protein ASPFODRAFT_49921 [Aspergillus luchuensis CBS 106.47]